MLGQKIADQTTGPDLRLALLFEYFDSYLEHGGTIRKWAEDHFRLLLRASKNCVSSSTQRTTIENIAIRLQEITGKDHLAQWEAIQNESNGIEFPSNTKIIHQPISSYAEITAREWRYFCSRFNYLHWRLIGVEKSEGAIALTKDMLSNLGCIGATIAKGDSENTLQLIPCQKDLAGLDLNLVINSLSESSLPVGSGFLGHNAIINGVSKTIPLAFVVDRPSRSRSVFCFASDSNCDPKLLPQLQTLTKLLVEKVL